MNPIGGYFELGVASARQHFHADACAVNFGRAGLRMILQARKYRKVHVPEYICPVVFDTLSEMGVAWETYPIDDRLEPVAIPFIDEHEGFIYVDYFGVKDQYCRRLEQSVRNLILDLTQAFFYIPGAGVDAFNSTRKFFGVPDGGYVFGDSLSAENLPQAQSHHCSGHLLMRLDGEVEGGYLEFKKNDAAMSRWMPMRMSKLTSRLLASIDYDRAREKRNRNFAVLHQALSETNQLVIDQDCIEGPMCYPFVTADGDALRRHLIQKRVFVPTYWPGLIDKMQLSVSAKGFVQNLVCIPCDQRYDDKCMLLILEVHNVRKY